MQTNMNSTKTETSPDYADVEAFVKYALIYYCRGVLQGRGDCTPEWKNLAQHVLDEVMRK